MFRLFLILALCVLPFFLAQTVLAQSNEELDSLLNEASSQNEQRPTNNNNEARPGVSTEELRQLVLFEDIVVIQRRFLPKVSRFEFYPHFGLVINNPFHFHFMMSGRLGYHFNEYLGVEAFGSYVNGPERGVTKDLKDMNVNVTNVLYSEYLFGLSLKWSPIYGKFGGVRQSILPFDMYVSGGAGMTHAKTTTTDGRIDSRVIFECETNTVVFNIETGQLIPITKSLAFRWSWGWFLYPTFGDKWTCDQIEGNPTNTQILPDDGLFGIDIHFSLGVSVFFPGAKYR